MIALPLTSSFALGVVVPIPTLPPEVIRMRSEPVVSINKSEALYVPNLPTLSTENLISPPLVD